MACTVSPYKFSVRLEGENTLSKLKLPEWCASSVSEYVLDKGFDDAVEYGPSFCSPLRRLELGLAF